VGLDGYDALRRSHFILMWLQYWEGLYVLGDMPESAVRHTVSSELFASAYGRQHWSAVRSIRLEDSTGRRLKFAKIVDEEYRKAIDSSFLAAEMPSPNLDEASETALGRLSRVSSGLLIGFAVGGVILTGRLLGRHLVNRSSRKVARARYEP
jgi:Family of unknown function (DUF6082)